MFNLKIVKLSQQKETKPLVKLLLGLGLNSSQVSNGLKVPPLLVLSTERERDAMELMDTIEKFGAVCVIENTEILAPRDESANEEAAAPVKKRKNKMGWIFGVVIVLVLVPITVMHYFTGDNKYKISTEKQEIKPAPKAQNNARPSINGIEMRGTGTLVADTSAKNSEKSVTESESKVHTDLKKEIVKNPYNDSAWKVLSENLEKEGDTASARAARESYEKAVKAQRVLSSLAKAFGNDVRVEIRENAVYYRTSKDFTDREFDREVQKLAKNLNSRFPGRDIIVENYTPSNKIQSTTIKAVK